MLHYWQLTEHLALVHASQAGAHSAPRAESRYVIEHGRVLAKMAALHLPDELDGAKVEIFRAIL